MSRLACLLIYFIVIQLHKDGGPTETTHFSIQHIQAAVQIKYVVQVNCRLQVAYTAYVSSCSSCGRKSLHEGIEPYRVPWWRTLILVRVGGRRGCWCFEDGSVVHRYTQKSCNYRPTHWNVFGYTALPLEL